MADYITREIDKIGQMLLLVAKKLGLFSQEIRDFSIDEVQMGLREHGMDIDLRSVITRENPVAFLVEQLKFSCQAVETFTELVMHSDVEEPVKRSFLEDAVGYLDHQGYFSFSLHSIL